MPKLVSTKGSSKVIFVMFNDGSYTDERTVYVPLLFDEAVKKYSLDLFSEIVLRTIVSNS